MRLSRLVPAIAAGALFVASTSPVQAQSEPEVAGVGTTTGALTLLGLDAGNLISLDLLSDSGSANIDQAAGPTSAAAQIAALALDTAATDPISVPLLAVSSTGERQQAAQEVALPANPLVSGSAVPLALDALVDDAGAHSSLAAALADLSVLGGILGLEGTQLDLGNDAASADAAGTRGIDVDALTVLDLEALLEALGIPLADLPLDTLLDLLDGLGLTPQLEALLAPLGIDITDLDTAGIVALVDGLVTEVDTVSPQVAEVEALTAELTSLQDLQQSLEAETAGACDLLSIDATLAELCTELDAVTAEIETVTAELDALPTLAELTALLEDLLAQLEALLGAPLDLLSGQPLLSLQGLDVSVLTKATDDVSTSVADVTGTLGTLQVGALPALGGLDLGTTSDQLNGLLTQAEGTIGSILGLIAPDLADLVSVRTLEETTSVTEDSGRVTSSAAFTGLQLDVLPALVDLEALLGSLGAVDSVGAVLGDLGLPVPTSGATEVAELNALLAPVTGADTLLGALAVLEDGLGLQVGTLSQTSTFTAVAAQAPVAPAAPAAPAGSPALPRTGSEDGLLLALAGAAVLAALGGRQLVRRSADA